MVVSIASGEAQHLKPDNNTAPVILFSCGSCGGSRLTNQNETNQDQHTRTQQFFLFTQKHYYRTLEWPASISNCEALVKQTSNVKNTDPVNPNMYRFLRSTYSIIYRTHKNKNNVFQSFYCFLYYKLHLSLHNGFGLLKLVHRVRYK